MYVRPMLVGHNVGLNKVDYVKCKAINEYIYGMVTRYCLTSVGKVQPFGLHFTIS